MKISSASRRMSEFFRTKFAGAADREDPGPGEWMATNEGVGQAELRGRARAPRP